MCEATEMFEAKPQKGALELAICRLSAKTADYMPSSKGTGDVELDPCDVAAASAGIQDPVARELIGVLQEHGPAVDRAVEALDIWGWHEWRRTRPKQTIQPREHRLLAESAVADYQHGINYYRVSDLAKHCGLPTQNMVQVMPHWLLLQSRVLEAENVLASHLARRLAA